MTSLLWRFGKAKKISRLRSCFVATAQAASVTDRARSADAARLSVHVEAHLRAFFGLLFSFPPKYLVKFFQKLHILLP